MVLRCGSTAERVERVEEYGAVFFSWGLGWLGVNYIGRAGE